MICSRAGAVDLHYGMQVHVAEWVGDDQNDIQIKGVEARDVRQWQRVSMARAVFTEQEWPLHPFPLQLPLAAVAAAIN